jgi:NAD-dependent protein deacetylase/lipoamidase
MNIVFFTGAGISRESGIPTFRGKGGIFNDDDNDAEAELTISRFRNDPERCWKFLRKIFEAGVGKTFNRAHEMIAAFKDTVVITQNIDSFHEDAGSKSVYYLHGKFGTGTCSSCGRKSEIKERLVGSKLPARLCNPKCECGGWVKPDIVFYDEALDMETYTRANEVSRAADIFVIIGTTGLVYPAAYIPREAKSAGAIIIEINPEESEYTENITDIFIKDKAISGMEKLLGEVLTLEYADGKLKDYKKWKKIFDMDSLVKASYS